MKLCGARGKRKREEIQIVDVNQQEVLNDAREWLLKGLMDDTTKRQSVSKKRGNEPTNQQKRKHQITYLAHQVSLKQYQSKSYYIFLEHIILRIGDYFAALQDNLAEHNNTQFIQFLILTS